MISFPMNQKKNRFQKAKEEKEAKKKQDEEEAAKVYESFVASFSTDDKYAKTFIRGGKVNGNDDFQVDRAGEEYRFESESKIEESEMERFLKEVKEKSAGSKQLEKELKPSDAPSSSFSSSASARKRQMDEFLEELKSKHEGHDSIVHSHGDNDAPGYYGSEKGSYDNGDPETTNLYVGNLHPGVTEEDLQEVFAPFGRVFSVKIMWPRSEAERSRGRNTGFVSYFHRKDAEEALLEVDNAMLKGQRIVVGWGKAIKITHAPHSSSYASDNKRGRDREYGDRDRDRDRDKDRDPDRNYRDSGDRDRAGRDRERGWDRDGDRDRVNMDDGDKDYRYTSSGRRRDDSEERHYSAASSGTINTSKRQRYEANDDNYSSFTATSSSNTHHRTNNSNINDNKRRWDRVESEGESSPSNPFVHISSANKKGRRELRASDHMVSIAFPADDRVKKVIDLVARYVAADGEAFEKSLKLREEHNSIFHFLFSSESEEGRYYRWRVYANLAGETEEQWRDEAFQLSPHGPFYLPPPPPPPSTYKKEKGERRSGEEREERDERRGRREKSDKGRGRERVLSSSDYSLLLQVLRKLDLTRESIKEAMGFCFDRRESAKEIVKEIGERLLLPPSSPPAVKIAGLFLLSDLLHNSASPLTHASHFKMHIQELLPRLFLSLGESLQASGGRLSFFNFNQQLQLQLAVWEEWGLFPPLFVGGLRAVLTYRERDEESREEVGEEGEGGDQEGEEVGLRRRAKTVGVYVPPILSKEERGRVEMRLRYVEGVLGGGEQGQGNGQGGVGQEGKAGVKREERDMDGEPLEGQYQEDVDGEVLEKEGERVENIHGEDIDGDPMEEEQAAGEQDYYHHNPSVYGEGEEGAEDIDGQPLYGEEDIDGVPLEED